MQFHLNYKPKPSVKKIDHQQNIFLIGSCFAENIGEKLLENGFHSHINPNGILFNPLSIYHCLIDLIKENEIDESLILARNNLFFSYLHHSSVYGISKEQLKLKLNEIQKLSKDKLEKSDFLIITFGTAFIYELKQTQSTVANCHKQKAELFNKRMLSIEEMVSQHNELIGVIKKLNPTIHIILTVSPVKYLKDGIEENSISKATLLLAVNQLCKTNNCSYFPAYELVTDDLRDHRFYKEDLAHPNELSINYVWEKFSDTYFSEDTKQLNNEIYAVKSALKHKLLHPEGEEAKQFLLNVKNKKTELLKKHPYLKI